MAGHACQRTRHRLVGTTLRTVAMALIPVTAAFAQAQAPPVTLRVDTRLVEISVVVKDRHGNPVSGLKQSDFALYDKGQEQEIRIFRVEDHRSTAQLPAPAATAPASTSTGTFTNRMPAPQASPNSPTVLLIDAGNTWDIKRMTWQDLEYARDQVIQFLRQVHPGDQLGIYLMGTDRFWILHEYNQNCADLLERLATWKQTDAHGAPGAKFRDVWTEFAVHFAQVDDETAKAIHRTQFYTPDPMVSSALPEEDTSLPKMHRGVSSSDSLGQDVPTAPVAGLRGEPAQSEQGAYILAGRNHAIEMLAGVANHLASVPGRKNLILISGKMFLPAQFKDRAKVLRTIIQDGVSIYAIDPAGIAPYDLDASFAIPSRVSMAARDSRQATTRYIKQNVADKVGIVHSLQSSLRTLAEDTGGRLFVNTNGIRDAIRSSFEDSRVTYTLGFYPRASVGDGSFHPIQVTLPAHRQLSVRYRTGYFEPAPASRDPKKMEGEMRQAVWSPLDANAIELSGSVLPIAGANRYELRLKIGMSGVILQPDRDRWSGQIEIALVQRDNVGNDYQPFLKTLGLMLTQDSYDKAMRTGLDFQREIEVNPKASSLRIVVRDVSTGSLGTLTFLLPR